MTTTQTILERIRSAQPAEPVKTASAPAPSTEQARQELEAAMASHAADKQAQAPASQQVPTDTAVLRKIAADLQAAETLALAKEAQVIGAALIEGMTLSVDRLPAQHKTASAAHPRARTKAELHATRLKLAYEQGLNEAQHYINQFRRTEETIMADQQKQAAADEFLAAAAYEQLSYANARMQKGVKHAMAQDNVSAGAEYLDTAFECGAHSLRTLAQALAMAGHGQ